MNPTLRDLLVKPDIKVLQAMNQLEVTEKKILFVVDDKSKLVGTLTDGDIRRWILAQGRLDDTISGAFNKHPYRVPEAFDLDDVRKHMREHNISCVPVVNEDGVIIKLLFWENLFNFYFLFSLC